MDITFEPIIMGKDIEYSSSCIVKELDGVVDMKRLADGISTKTLTLKDQELLESRISWFHKQRSPEYAPGGFLVNIFLFDNTERVEDVTRIVKSIFTEQVLKRHDAWIENSVGKWGAYQLIKITVVQPDDSYEDSLAIEKLLCSLANIIPMKEEN